MVLVRIGLVWLAANFAELTISQYLKYWVFPLRCSFQLILHWWAPNQRIKFDNVRLEDKEEKRQGETLEISQFD